MAELFNDREAIEAERLFVRYKRYGLPFGSAWALTPARIIEVIDLLEPVDRIYHPRLF